MTSPKNSHAHWPLLVAVAVAGTGLLGCRRSHAAPQGDGQTAQSMVDSVKNSGGRHLAPHDTFYLLDYVSAKTSTGVIGFEPGQQVRLVEVHRDSRTLVVGDGQAQVEVGPEKLTNDMDIAALVRQKDQANQAKIAAYVQAEQKAYDDSKRASAINTEKDMEKINKQERESSTVNGNDSKLNQPAQVVDGSAGYGYAGSAYYGSPYSYFNGPTTATTTTAPAASSRTTNPATVGH